MKFLAASTFSFVIFEIATYFDLSAIFDYISNKYLPKPIKCKKMNKSNHLLDNFHNCDNN